MRIRFSVDGGIAAFPGLAKPVTIDCAKLSSVDSAHLRDLVHRADFFARPIRGQAARMPDARAYTIAIDDGPQCRRTMTLTEPIADAALRDLVAGLHERARALRGAR